MKPFVTFSVKRYHGAALVTIVRITDVGADKPLKREVLEEYETASNGASRSARRSMRKYQ